MCGIFTHEGAGLFHRTGCWAWALEPEVVCLRGVCVRTDGATPVLVRAGLLRKLSTRREHAL